MKKWKTLSSKLAFDNPWFKVQQDTVELPNGKILDDYFMYREGDCVVIVPVTPDNQVILVKQYKHAAGEELIEFPAGYLNKDETPEEAVKRELLEETGYSYTKMTKLFASFANPTKIIGTYHFFLVEGCSLVGNNPLHQDETESIEVLLKSPKEIFDMLMTNEIKAIAAYDAAFMAFQKLGYISFGLT